MLYICPCLPTYNTTLLFGADGPTAPHELGSAQEDAQKNKRRDEQVTEDGMMRLCNSWSALIC
jgi:hypothetical protein